VKVARQGVALLEKVVLKNLSKGEREDMEQQQQQQEQQQQRHRHQALAPNSDMPVVLFPAPSSMATNVEDEVDQGGSALRLGASVTQAIARGDLLTHTQLAEKLSEAKARVARACSAWIEAEQSSGVCAEPVAEGVACVPTVPLPSSMPSIGARTASRSSSSSASLKMCVLADVSDAMRIAARCESLLGVRRAYSSMLTVCNMIATATAEEQAGTEVAVGKGGPQGIKGGALASDGTELLVSTMAPLMPCCECGTQFIAWNRSWLWAARRSGAGPGSGAAAGGGSYGTKEVRLKSVAVTAVAVAAAGTESSAVAPVAGVASALAEYEMAAAQAATCGDTAGELGALTSMVTTALGSGKILLARKYAIAAVSALEAAETREDAAPADSLAEARAHETHGLLNLLLKRNHDALPPLRKALANCMGLSSATPSGPPAASSESMPGRARAEAQDQRPPPHSLLQEARASGNLGVSLMRTLRYSEAEESHLQHLAMAEELGEEIDEIIARSNIGRVLALQHRFEEALLQHTEQVNAAVRVLQRTWAAHHNSSSESMARNGDIVFLRRLVRLGLADMGRAVSAWKMKS
jgi:hypothetical protein